MSEQVNKQNIIEENRSHDKDTGSSEVQIALLTARIAHLTEHLKTHRKDFSLPPRLAYDGSPSEKIVGLPQEERP